MTYVYCFFFSPRLLQDRPIKFICRGKIKVKGLERKQMTYYVEPLEEGEESVTVYLPSDGIDSGDGMSYASSTQMGRLNSDSFSDNGNDFYMQKGRSLSLATNASFSLITSPLVTSEQNAIRRSSLVQAQKKSSITSDTSTTRMITVPIIEERTETPSEPSTTSISTGTRRNQVSPYNSDIAIQKVDAPASFNKTVKTKHGHSKKKCTIS